MRRCNCDKPPHHALLVGTHRPVIAVLIIFAAFVQESSRYKPSEAVSNNISFCAGDTLFCILVEHFGQFLEQVIMIISDEFI